MYGKLISSIKLGTHSSAVDSVPFPCAAENPINVIKGSSLSLSLFFSLSPKKKKILCLHDLLSILKQTPTHR